MNITYTASSIISADKESVVDFFKQPRMSQDYFPEVRKDVSSMSQYIQSTHAETTQVYPGYRSASGFGWTAGSGTIIRLPRKDILLNITAIDVECIAKRHNTQVKIVVSFETGFNTSLPFALRCVRAMVKAKLNAFARDISSQDDLNYLPHNFAY